MYSPLRVFVTIGGVLTLGGFAVCARFLWFYLENGGAGHVQSLLLGVLLLVLGFGTAMLGLLADVIAGNRRLLEELLRRVREVELAQNQDRAMSDTRDATTSPADITVSRKAARSLRAAVGDPSS